MEDFTKAFAPIMLDGEITIQISRSDYSRIESGKDATVLYNGAYYDVSYDFEMGKYYITVDGVDIYIEY